MNRHPRWELCRSVCGVSGCGSPDVRQAADLASSGLPGDLVLDELHDVLQVAMGWQEASA
ncbi:Uncharacterised protein [Mycobacteroides abscessus]|nr:Uncharacterised protein [Mycobacteroides abscessus]